MSSARKLPETLSQARTWERCKGIYLDAGLCHACACQAAWGHQLGFRTVKPPCEACAPVVASFPVPKGRVWRGFAKSDRRPSGMPSRGPQKAAEGGQGSMAPGYPGNRPAVTESALRA
jgi:hypothetical protein